MSNNGTMSYVISMLRQINQTTLALSQNQNLLFEQFESLDQKIDNKINEIDKKFDNKIDELDKKFDNKINELDKKFDNKFNELQRTVLSMQKEIKDMHEDITTIYTLEIDSRKKLQRIM